MKVTVLGGGSEIGASCLHIQMDETNILIDAGMRMHGEDQLPMIGMLEELGKPEAMLVTHAHADHIGALPVVHSMYPDMPIYATPPTVDLMHLMMRDSFKIMTEQSRLNQTLMPYTEEEMKQMLEKVRVFPANGKMTLSDLSITIFRAGHIMGAVMILLEKNGESILVTGDISFKGGRTIPGAKVADGIQPDVVVMESTYGNRLHTDRNTEEKRLASHVADTIEQGGFALIPAFALGRAQEVLLVLQDYMEKGLIPAFPIYVDGLVTPISKIYRNYPHYLKGPAAHRVRTNGDAFLTEGRCIPVEPKDREKIVNGKPACIVASSGMLTGGASAWYAKHVVTNPKNAVYLTGYQDEESPGKKLLALADGKEDKLDINGTSYPVKCSVDKFGLSAHADASEMTRFIETLAPTYTLLVHGDDDARSALAEKIHPRFHPMLSENGETYPFEKRKDGNGVVGKKFKRNHEQERLRSYIGNVLLYKKDTGDVLKFGLCQNVHPKIAVFHCETPKGKLDKVDKSNLADTLGPWGLSIEAFAEVAASVLAFSRPYLKNVNWDKLPDYTMSLQEVFEKLETENPTEQFAIAMALQAVPDTCRDVDIEGRVGYKLTHEIRFKLSNLDLPIQALKRNPNHAMDHIRNYFSDYPRFLRCGVKENGTSNEHILLSFDFPASISEKERKQMTQDILEQTGWAVTFSDAVRHEAFQPLIASLLEKNVDMPSVHILEGVVVAKETAPKNSQAVKEKFEQRTGFQLHFAKEAGNEAGGAGSATDQQLEKADDIFLPPSDVKPLENNEAIAFAKQFAADQDVRVFKTGMKQRNGQPLMELHFISPEVALGYAGMMSALSAEIGMAVTYAKAPKQNEIIHITNQTIPDSWQPKGNPSVHMDKATVAVKVGVLPDETELAVVQESIKAETGYALELK